MATTLLRRRDVARIDAGDVGPGRGGRVGRWSRSRWRIQSRTWRPPRPARRELRADAQRNRERIIAAAIEVFAERGLDASTAEIAQRAGVGEATLFRRFPSKDDLIQAIVETQMETVIEIATDCLEDPDPGEGLERFLTEMVERSVADRGVWRRPRTPA